MQIQVNHITSSGLQGGGWWGGGGLGWMPMVLVMTKNYLFSSECTTSNYFLLLNSQEQTVGTAQVSIVCWNGTRFRYVKVHIP